MATSPREELVIDSLVVFGKFDGGWVWAEQLPDSNVVTDSGHKAFDSIDEAVADFLDDEQLDIHQEVDPTEAHYSELIPVGPEPHSEYHIRKYKYGAPNPMQRVTA
jgi:hypothetical protein